MSKNKQGADMSMRLVTVVLGEGAVSLLSLDATAKDRGLEYKRVEGKWPPGAWRYKVTGPRATIAGLKQDFEMVLSGWAIVDNPSQANASARRAIAAIDKALLAEAVRT